MGIFAGRLASIEVIDPIAAQEVKDLVKLRRCDAADAEIEAPWDRHLGVFRNLISVHGLEGGEALYQISLTCQLGELNGDLLNPFVRRWLLFRRSKAFGR